MSNSVFRQWLAISCLAALLTACGGGGGSGGGNSRSDSSQSTQSPAASPNASPSPETPAPTLSEPRSVHVSWTIPTVRTDGSALLASAIAGYRLYYMRDGSNPNDDTVVPISGGDTTSTELSLTIAGTYIFAITAIDTVGAESPLSTPVSITVN